MKKTATGSKGMVYLWDKSPQQREVAAEIDRHELNGVPTAEALRQLLIDGMKWRKQGKK